VPQDIFVTKFDASAIIEIVEKGIFLKDNEYTHDTISRTLKGLKDTNLDVLVLSSTHLSFVRSNIISMYPSIKVIDPALNTVKEIRQFLKTNNNLRKSGQGRISIIVNGDKNEFQELLKEMGFPGPVERYEK
jgi:glutamate racemase